MKKFWACVVRATQDGGLIILSNPAPVVLGEEMIIPVTKAGSATNVAVYEGSEPKFGNYPIALLDIDAPPSGHAMAPYDAVTITVGEPFITYSV